MSSAFERAVQQSLARKGMTLAQAEETGKIIYYNANLAKNTNDGIFSEQAITFDYRTDIILGNPSRYYGSIIRFSAPGNLIPLSIPVIQTGQSNVALTEYSFTLGYNGVFSDQIYLLYVTSDLSAPTPKAPTVIQDSSTTYYFIYNYGTIADMINVALTKAFISLSGKTTLPMGALAPQFAWDPVNAWFVFNLDTTYDPATTIPPVQIYYNQSLDAWMTGFESLQVSNPNNPSPIGTDIQLLCKKNFLNATTYGFQFTQSYKSFNSLMSLSTILVTSNLPSIKEYTTAPIALQNTSQNNTIPLVTDFIPPLDSNANSFQSQFIYNASSLYRIFELAGTNPIPVPIYTSIQWQDNLGIVRPLYIYGGVSASIKIMFVDKSLFSLL